MEYAAPNTDEPRYSTQEEAEEVAEALMAEDDMDYEVAYVNEGRTGDGYWIVEVANEERFA